MRQLTTEERHLRTFPEAWVQKTAQDMLDAYGWLWYHAPDNYPSANGRKQNIQPGWPDIIAVRGKRIVVLELKRETGFTTEAQDQWLAAFQLTEHVEVHTIRPRQIQDGTLQAILRPDWGRGK